MGGFNTYSEIPFFLNFKPNFFRTVLAWQFDWGDRLQKRIGGN